MKQLRVFKYKDTNTVWIVPDTYFRAPLDLIVDTLVTTIQMVYDQYVTRKDLTEMYIYETDIIRDEHNPDYCGYLL